VHPNVYCLYPEGPRQAAPHICGFVFLDDIHKDDQYSTDLLNRETNDGWHGEAQVGSLSYAINVSVVDST
jgi:hypothetical protein